jgi:4'-phosphopantetheinyl transferase
MTTPESSWEKPPQELALPDGEVHVWRADLDRPAARIEELAQTLSADERERAGRFHFEEHRARFIAARGVLRTLLGRYLSTAPQELKFCYSAHGKPALDGLSEAGTLCFNLSHSHTLALYAMNRDRQVGIDVEHRRRNVDDEQVAGRFFARAEVEALQALPEALREAAFFNCWTRKEAYLKARGEGVTRSLDSFAVSLQPGEPAALLNCTSDPGEVARWSLRALNPGPDYAAALCVAGNDWQLRCYQWSD